MDAETAMTGDVTWIDEDTPIEHAWKLMNALRVRHLPVIEHGKLVGIISDRDLLMRAQRGLDGVQTFPDLCAAEVMTFGVVSRPADADVTELAALMVEHCIDSIPITDGEQLVGLVTSTDLLSLLAEKGLGS